MNYPALEHSFNSDYNLALAHFKRRWPNTTDHEQILRRKILPSFWRELNHAKTILHHEIKEDIEFATAMLSYDLAELQLKAIEKLKNFEDYQNPSQLNKVSTAETFNLIMDALREDQELHGYSMCVHDMVSLINKLVSDFINKKLDEPTNYELLLATINFITGAGKWIANPPPLLEVTIIHLIDMSPDYDYELMEQDEDNLGSLINKAPEMKIILIDLIYLYIMLRNVPTEPTKPTKLWSKHPTENLLANKNGFALISELEATSFQQLQHTLETLKSSEKKMFEHVDFIKESRDRGRNKKHRFSHKYKSLIQSETLNSFRKNPQVHYSEIFSSEPIQDLISQCRNEQRADRVKEYLDQTFIRWIASYLNEMIKEQSKQ